MISKCSVTRAALASMVIAVAAGSASAQTTPPPTPPAAAPPAVAAPAPPPPSPINEAFAKAAGDVLQNATVPEGARVDLLIDPLIDGNTGAQSVATRSMEAQLRKLIADKYAAKFQVKPFTSDNLGGSPFIFIGTFTPIHATANAAGPKDAYRLCFAILDLKAQRIASKGFARATVAGINIAPTPSFAERAVFAKDAATDGYVRTCQGTKAGEPINPAYLERIKVAAQIADAIQAYDRGQYKKAHDLYTQVAALPGGDQLRVYNGLYLTNLRLNRKADAEKAFAKLVDYGMHGDRIGLMMLFTKGTTRFYPQPIAKAYPMWLKAVADKAASQKSCIEVAGHTSHTGTEPFNDKLSVLRADAVRASIAKIAPAVATSFTSAGKGWRENLVGTGKDDATDALDRRVEFKVAKCA